MARLRKKGERGSAVTFMTRNRAVRKLQISLADFRRLCILKGVYPREPKKKVHGSDKTYYLTKDIHFLLHEPLLAKFRELKIFLRKFHHAVARKEYRRAERLEANRPVVTVDHLVKERYPSFHDALRDLDDALSFVHLFATFPTAHRSYDATHIHLCQRLSREFQAYIARSRSLRRVFISIKGFYFQAEVMGETVTWVVPFRFAQELPTEVDYRIMTTFVQFYETLLKFVNFKLYHSLGLLYPPTVDEKMEAEGGGLRTLVLKAMDGSQGDLTTPTTREDSAIGTGDFEDVPEVQTMREEERKREQVQRLFVGKKFFLGREVPRDVLEFVILSFGGDVGWEGDASSFSVDSEDITHQVVDRPTQNLRFLSRCYIQPQWVFDCINAQILLPPGPYAPGTTLPPHLSPFVDNEAEGYVPERAVELARLRGEEVKQEDKEEDTGPQEPTEHDEEELYVRELAHEFQTPAKIEPKQKQRKKVDNKTSKAEEKEFAKIMMSRKNRKLYDRMEKATQKKETRTQKLRARRTSHTAT